MPISLPRIQVQKDYTDMWDHVGGWLKTHYYTTASFNDKALAANFKVAAPVSQPLPTTPPCACRVSRHLSNLPHLPRLPHLATLAAGDPVPVHGVECAARDEGVQMGHVSQAIDRALHHGDDRDHCLGVGGPRRLHGETDIQAHGRCLLAPP